MPQLTEDETGSISRTSTSRGGDDDVEGAGVSRDDIEDAPIVRFVNKLLLDAIRRGASDIHFEPYEKMYRIRLRMDGILKEVAQPPVQLAMKLSARLKVMSRLDIAERRVPQDGRIKMKLSKTRAIDFRVSTCPTLFGEKIVCRILDPSQAMLGIDSLGYEPFQREIYLKNLAKPQGMILVTGPTGSGKTVSLYTGLNILNREDTNISTAEDPAEINLPGVNQVNVNNKVGLTFAAALRAFLRQDPDVVMVGEIRDLETAEIAIKAAQTGHLVHVHAAHQRRAADAHASGRHGREALRHRHLGEPDHRAAPGAPPVLAVQGARRHSRRGPAQGRLPGSRRRAPASRSTAPRVAGLHRRLQGPRAASTRSCRSPKHSAASSWKAATPSTSRTRPPKKACGICAARGSRRSRQASPVSKKSTASRSNNAEDKRAWQPQ